MGGGNKLSAKPWVITSLLVPLHLKHDRLDLIGRRNDERVFLGFPERPSNAFHLVSTAINVKKTVLDVLDTQELYYPKLQSRARPAYAQFPIINRSDTSGGYSNMMNNWIKMD